METTTDPRTLEYLEFLKKSGSRQIPFPEFKMAVERLGYSLVFDFRYRNTLNPPYAWNAEVFQAIAENGDSFCNVSNAKHPGLRGLQEFRSQPVFALHAGRLVEL